MKRWKAVLVIGGICVVVWFVTAYQRAGKRLEEAEERRRAFVIEADREMQKVGWRVSAEGYRREVVRFRSTDCGPGFVRLVPLDLRDKLRRLGFERLQCTGGMVDQDEELR